MNDEHNILITQLYSDFNRKSATGFGNQEFIP